MYTPWVYPLGRLHREAYMGVSHLVYTPGYIGRYPTWYIHPGIYREVSTLGIPLGLIREVSTLGMPLGLIRGNPVAQRASLSPKVGYPLCAECFPLS